MASILYHIITNPEVHQKLMAELDDHFDAGEVPNHEGVKGLEYLQACIDEGYGMGLVCSRYTTDRLIYSLRFHATTSIGLPRVVGEGGLVCCGKFFPEGVRILFSVIPPIPDRSYRLLSPFQ